MRGVGVDITILEGRRERVNSLDVCLVGNAWWIVDWVGNFMGIFEVRVGGGVSKVPPGWVMGTLDMLGSNFSHFLILMGICLIDGVAGLETFGW